VIKLVLAQLEKAPQPLHELCADVPIELSAVVARMLSKDPAQRYQKPIEVAQALLPFIKAGGKLGENAAAVTGKSSARIGTVLGGDTSRSSGLGQKLPNRAPGPAIPPPIIEDIGPQWDSIVDSDETNRVAKQRRPRLGSQPNGGRLFSLKKWHWIGASAGALLLGLLLLLAAGVIRVKTPNGILVIENVPADAEVTVDGEKVMFSRNGQQVTVETTKEGQFLIKVMSNGVELLSSNVLVKLDGKPVRIFIERDKNFAKYETIPSRKTPDSIPKRKPGGVAEVEIVSGVPSKAPGSIPVRKPGEVAEFEISSGVKMRYCWIPAGKATLGSPASEEMRNNNEAEHEFVTTGFWLGKYTVTKGEWSAVMSNAADANLFPAEVSWDESQSFIKELNNSTKIRASFGMGKFCLPQEDEWEYAARGGKGNRQAFYFGNEANGTQANCNGDTPYGTAMTGPFRGRTTPVGSFENIAPHPWSLCDMVGNVFQWCDNVADNDGRFIVRGGCWNNEPFLCRSASRHGRLRGLTGFRVGFRVCFRPVETEIDAEERSKKLIVGRWRSDRQDLFVFHPDGKLVMFNVAGVMLSTGRWEAKKDGTVTTALENGWSGINTIHADGTQTCKLKNPAGEPAGKWTASKEDE
jgi:formylglycine-generating enzyme required for sulfatase activity